MFLFHDFTATIEGKGECTSAIPNEFVRMVSFIANYGQELLFRVDLYNEMNTRHIITPHTTSIAVVTSLTNSFSLYATVCRRRRRRHRCLLRNCSKKSFYCSISLLLWIHFIKLYIQLLANRWYIFCIIKLILFNADQ